MPSTLPGTAEPSQTLPTTRRERSSAAGLLSTVGLLGPVAYTILSLWPQRKNKGIERPAIILVLGELDNLHMLGRLIIRIFFLPFSCRQPSLSFLN